MKKLLLVCLSLLLFVPVLAGCAEPGSASKGILVPPSANMVVKVDVSRILNNPVLSIAYTELAKTETDWPATVNDVVARVLQETGIDLSSISTAYIFGDIESMDHSQQQYAGMIASGSFNESDIVARVEQKLDKTLDTASYKDTTIYSNPDDEYALAFPGQGLLVAGAPQAVRDTIDVHTGDLQPLSGTVMDSLDRFESALIAGVFAPPAALRDQLDSEASGKLPVPVTLFKDMDMSGFSVNQSGISLSVRSDAHFTNDISVQNARDTVAGLITTAKGIVQDADIKAILDKLQVSIDGSWVSVQGLIGPADIATIVGKLQKQ